MDAEVETLESVRRRALLSYNSAPLGRWSESKLNFDIYEHIMSILADKEFIAMMCTCSTLHSAGIKHLLKLPVKLSSVWGMQTFCQFISQDTPRRVKLIRTLRLSLKIHMVAHATAGLLIQLLIDASGLRRLENDIEAKLLME